MAASTGYLSIGAVQPGTSTGTSLSRLSIGAVQPRVLLSTGTLTVTLGDVSVSGSGTATTPTPTSGGLSLILGSLTASATATATAPTPSSGGLAVTLASTTLSAGATHIPPTPSSGGLAVTLASTTLSAGATHIPPTPSSGGLAVTLASTTLSAGATHIPPTPSNASMVLVLNPVTLTATATYTLPADMVEAIVGTCNADATLLGLFGRPKWLWINEAPDREPMPYAVLSQPESNLAFSSIQDDGSEPAVESAMYQVSIFSTNRALNRSIGERINAWLTTADLQHTDGYLMAMWLTSAADLLDPDRGPGGVDIWQRVLMLDCTEGHNQTVISTTYSPAQPAADLTEALVGLLGTDATLASSGYFNRATWLWFGEAPDTEPLPYAVLVQTQSIRDFETVSSDGSRPVIERMGYECHVFATNRATCRMLGERIAGLVDGATVTFANGYPMYLRRQSDTDELDDDRSRLGADVWHRTITITAISGHSET